LQPLLPKTGGWDILALVISHVAYRTHRFFTPLFSSPYKSLFSQLLCFHIHLRCPIVFFAFTWHSQIRNSRRSSAYSAPACRRQVSALSFIRWIFRDFQTRRHSNRQPVFS
jgi:hypothetical protein